MPSLRDAVSSLGATLTPWGVGSAWLPDTFGAPEAEYAAIHRHVGILPGGHRGLVRVTGNDRLDLINRLATNKFLDANPGLAGLGAKKAAGATSTDEAAGGYARRAFVLDGEGRIRCDFTAFALGNELWLDTDAVDAAQLAKIIGDRVFTEDCAAQDLGADWSRLSLLGPAAPRLLSLLCGQELAALKPWEAQLIALGGESCHVYRHDQTGTPNLQVWVPEKIAVPLFHAMLEAAGFDPAQPVSAETANLRRDGLRGRPIGWDAFNTARIEAGTALFHLDFGPDSLPAECGAQVFAEAVHLQKGCYPGQEAVARMSNMGHPKRILVGLKCAELPPAGAQVLEGDAEKRKTAPRGGQIGGVTGSTISPMLGAVPLALAVVKWGKHTPGMQVAVEVNGAAVAAEVVGLPVK